MKTQQHSILSVIQTRNNGCFVIDVAKQYGRKQTIMTPNYILLHLVIKNGLTYLEHYRPTAKKIRDITREKFMTSKSDWHLSKFDDIEGAPDLQIQ